MAKAWAVVEGVAYCGRCYNQHFVDVPCQQCGLPTRSPFGKRDIICRSCKIQGRKCIRCEKPVPRAGLVTDEGTVCPSCARYFHDPKPCPECGHVTHHLARDRRNGFDEPVCERCRRKDHVTCAECGKHRRAISVNHAGKPICAKCADLKGAPFICPQCHRPGRRHSNSKCDRCYWQESAGKRFEKQVVRISRPWIKKAFTEFFDALFDLYDSKTLSLRLKRYCDFFVELDNNFHNSKDLSFSAMADLFGADKLRRNSIILDFLTKHEFIENLDSLQRQHIFEEVYQKRLLQKISSEWYFEILSGLHQHLLDRVKRYRQRGWSRSKHGFRPHSATVTLKAAYQFLRYLTAEKIMDVRQIDQIELDKFLQLKPGYQNSIRGFVGYLNRVVKMFRPLKIEHQPYSLPKDSLLTPARCEQLLCTWLQADNQESQESLILTLMLLYAQKAHEVLSLKLSDLLQNEQGLYAVAFGKTEIILDEKVSALIDRYLVFRRSKTPFEKSWENSHLFPGRKLGGQLSTVTVGRYVNKYGVTAKSLFATAVHNSYVNGVKHPKVLVNALGISSFTAMRYRQDLDLRLNDEVAETVKSDG